MPISDQLAKAVVEGIQEQMNRCPYHDVIVIVDGTEFKCHRFLLSACSDFFRALFQSGMKEALENKVILRDISSTVFKLVIDSVYFANEILTADNISSVLHAANQLQIGYLLSACEIFQCKRLSRENCVSIYNDSKFLSAKKLQDLSWDVIIKEFNYLRKGDDIYFFDYNEIKRLVGDDNLNIPSEDVVIETIMRWVRFNPNEYLVGDFKDGNEFSQTDQRESMGGKITISVDQGQEDPVNIQGPSNNNHEYSNSVLSNNPVDCKGPSNNNQEYSNSVLSNNPGDSQDPSNSSNSNQENSNSVVSNNQNNYGADCNKAVVNFDLKERREDVVSNRREFLSELLAASKLLLVSGACLVNLLENKLILEDPKSFALVREGIRYNLQLDGRHSFCPCYGKYRNTSLLQNVIFTISISDTNRLKYLFRTLDGKWFLNLTVNAWKCRAVTYGNYIYMTAVGSSHNTAFKYDNSVNKWTQIASMIVPREDHALVCLNNFMYAIGGADCTSIERFDVEAEQKEPDTAKWENYGNLVQPMTNVMATTCHNIIVIFGSEIEDSPSTIVQTFNPQSTSLNIFMDDMPGPAKNMVSFKHGEDIFVLQENGALWKVNLDSSLLLNIEFHAMLWGDPFKLMGAVVTNQELLVFGEDIDPQMSRDWAVCDFEHFKRIKIIERQGYCFLNTVIPKRFLLTPES